MARSRRKYREWLTAVCFILPNVCGFLLFVSIPVVASLLLSLFAWDTFHPPRWVGLDNFTDLLGFAREEGRIVASDPEFWYSGFNTVFMMLAIPASISLSLAFAILLNRKLKGERLLAGQGWVAFEIGLGGVLGALAALAAGCGGLGVPMSLGLGGLVWAASTALMYALWKSPPAWGRALQARNWTVLRVSLAVVICLLVVLLVGSLRGQWGLALLLGALSGVILAPVLAKPIVSARTMFFLPSVTAGVAIYLMWIWLLNPYHGPINQFLGMVGIRGPAWLGGGFEIAGEGGKARLLWYWAKPAIMMMGVWIGMGGTNMILYLAALQGIDPQLYEAAEIDGANAWQKFRHITLPMVAPTTFFIGVTSVIGGFQGGFNSAYVMTGGGPERSTTTLSYYIFQQAFQYFHMGYAAATAWVLFAVVFVFTVLLWRSYGKGTVH